MSFMSVMETIGKGFAKGLKWAVEYAVPVEKLVGLLFPAAAPVANEVGRCYFVDSDGGVAGGAEVCGLGRAERHGGAEAGGGDAADGAGGDGAAGEGGDHCG